VAAEFSEHHLLALPGLRDIDRAEPIGAPASRAYFAELAADPKVGDKVAGNGRHGGVPAQQPGVTLLGRHEVIMTNITRPAEPRQARRGARHRTGVMRIPHFCRASAYRKHHATARLAPLRQAWPAPPPCFMPWCWCTPPVRPCWR
jgi:hypothetical protein